MSFYILMILYIVLYMIVNNTVFIYVYIYIYLGICQGKFWVIVSGQLGCEVQ